MSSKPRFVDVTGPTPGTNDAADVPEGIKSGDNFKVPTGRGVLSAAEIEALLRPDIPEDAFEEPKSVEPLVPAQLEAGPQLNKLLEDAGALASRLTLCLRKTCQLETVLRVETARHAPLSHLVSQHKGDPVLIMFADASGMLRAGLMLDHNIATLIVERAYGGTSAQPLLSGPHKLSRLDIKILEEVLQPLAAVLDPSFKIAGIETDRSAAHALLPPGKAMLAELNCVMAGTQGRASFARMTPTPVKTEISEPEKSMSRLMTDLTARIASLNVPVSQLSDLKAGSILLLGLPTDQPVELLSGGHKGEVVAEGDIGRRGNKVAVRITRRKG